MTCLRMLTDFQYREFFCKFVGLCYWDCDWIDEVRMEQHSGKTVIHDLDTPDCVKDSVRESLTNLNFHVCILVHMWRIYCRKNNMETEPETEDVDNFDDKKLAEKFYRYHINPDWLNVPRIINHRLAAKKRVFDFMAWAIIS